MYSSKVMSLAFQAVKWTQYQMINRHVCNNAILLSSCSTSLRIPHSTLSLPFQSNISASSNLEKTYPLQIPIRFYASKKNAKKQTNVQVSLNLLEEYIDVGSMVKEMESAIETMKSDFVKQLSLRSVGSIETLRVKYEGKEYEIQQVAKLTRKGQQTIVVDTLSFPQMTKAVVDALRTSSLNLNPQQEGTTIFVPIPKVTKEHREILAKKAKVLFITCRDTIRSIQEKNVKEMKSGDDRSSEVQTAIKQLKTLADKYIGQSETLMKAKQDELVGK